MTLQIASSIEEVVKPFKGVLLDSYGVIWGGGGVGPLPGAKETMKYLVSSGKIVGILSNTTQLAFKEIDKFKTHGLYLGEHFHFFLTSGEIMKEVLEEEYLPFPTPNKKFWLLGEPHQKYSSHNSLFEKSAYQETKDFSQADFIYPSIPHRKGEDQTDPSVFRQEINALGKNSIPMICPNPDLFAHEGLPPRAVVRQGSLARIFQEQGGDVFYFGKPEKIAYQKAMEKFSSYGLSNPEEILMVGDTPEIDIRGAKNSNMASALVLYTGMMADKVRKFGLEKAIDTCEEKDRPDFFLLQFGMPHVCSSSESSL